MHLGFYYHSPFIKDDFILSTPSYLGVFLESLLPYVDKLTIFGHLSANDDLVNCDYKINNEKIVFLNIGLKTSSWHRYLFNKRILKKFSNEAKKCNALLVRGPSPLAPFFYTHFGDLTKTFYLIVGDYTQVHQLSNDRGLRQRVSKYLDFLLDKRLTRSIKCCPTFVNGRHLYEKYSSTSEDISEIKTTTISKKDLFFRKDSFQDNQKYINILYAGRLDLKKGLIEILEASILLIKENYKIKVHFVGWEESQKEEVKNKLIGIAKRNNAIDYIFFHGKKSVGSDLFQLYRDAQLFLLPSYYEGFPRTISVSYTHLTLPTKRVV